MGPVPTTIRVANSIDYVSPVRPMGYLFPVFGPDTSVGLLPVPTILLYYAIFFFFGAMYFDCG